MGLMNKLFGGGRDASAPAPHSRPSQFAQSEVAGDPAKSRNAPRRELIQVVLRDTMRKHGIPSDWVECRNLSVVTRQQKSGMHVQFLVRKADEQLLPYVHAFQESFWEQILRFEPQAKEWLFSVGWEFYGKSKNGFSPMPDPTSWDDGDTQPPEAGDTLPPEMDDPDVLATDLQALQAAMSMPADLTNLPEAQPRQHRPPGKS
jgi:hypothetical protein